jgi:hypothetical protein
VNGAAAAAGDSGGAENSGGKLKVAIACGICTKSKV